MKNEKLEFYSFLNILICLILSIGAIVGLHMCFSCPNDYFYFLGFGIHVSIVFDLSFFLIIIMIISLSINIELILFKLKKKMRNKELREIYNWVNRLIID